MDYRTQIQMRFSLLETSCEQEDNFPPSICVKINYYYQLLSIIINYYRCNVLYSTVLYCTILYRPIHRYPFSKRCSDVTPGAAAHPPFRCNAGCIEMNSQG